MPFLFEFMDQRWIPASLHSTLREVLGFHLRVTLGYYYRWLAAEALARTERDGLTSVTELGAGAAGFSQTLAELVRTRKLEVTIQISDLRPDRTLFRELERAYPDVIRACDAPLDFVTGPAALDGEGLIVLSAAFHHVPPDARPRVLRGLSGRRVLVGESVTRTFLSMFGCAIGCIPALLTPLYFLGTRNGRLRRFLWCWLVPMAPLMVAWDGVVSCLRCWTEEEWRDELERVGIAPADVRIARRRFSHLISW